MEEIFNDLEEIVKEQLKTCKEKKEAPSKEVLDAIVVLDKLS